MLGLVLFAAILGESATLYFGTDSTVRLAVGLFLLAVIIWLSGRLGVVEFIIRSLRGRRRFMRLRRTVRHLLAEVRRLNWIAVDVERGYRSGEAAAQEMDVIESRLLKLVREIRSTAGKLELDPDTIISSAAREAPSEGGDTPD